MDARPQRDRRRTDKMDILLAAGVDGAALEAAGFDRRCRHPQPAGRFRTQGILSIGKGEL